jgi:uncharacterized repeat protein (TIGR03803 family)
VFELDSSGTESVIYTFTGGADGDDPVDALDKDGSNLAGTTLSGGTYGLGTVFTVDQSGTETVLHNFTGQAGWIGPCRECCARLQGQSLWHHLRRRRLQPWNRFQDRHHW